MIVRQTPAEAESQRGVDLKAMVNAHPEHVKI